MDKQIVEFEKARMKSEVPEFKPGDTVRVSVKIIEGEKERIQDFEGVCIRRKGGGLGETFTLRRVSYGVGMERIFPLHSPLIQAIKVVRQGKVRRAKLYYLRELRGKKARITERRRELAIGAADERSGEGETPSAQK
jgi:large subunit ribosomal protein L19